MITKIYFIGIILVSLWVLYLYITDEQEYKREMEKIEMLERKEAQRKRELEEIRTLTQPCPITGLDNPRRCFIESNRICSWNEMAERCDKK
jgi:hypothetical protein